jgi:YD repeat-containing protein
MYGSVSIPVSVSVSRSDSKMTSGEMPMNQRTVYTYNELNRLTSVTYATGTKIIYTYDPAGNMTSLTVGPGTGKMPVEVKPVATVSKVVITCSKCGKIVPEDARFCPSCGNLVSAPAGPRPHAQVERLCPRCHRPVPAGKKFCTYDGTPITSST